MNGEKEKKGVQKEKKRGGVKPRKINKGHESRMITTNGRTRKENDMKKKKKF